MDIIIRNVDQTSYSVLLLTVMQSDNRISFIGEHGTADLYLYVAKHGFVELFWSYFR